MKSWAICGAKYCCLLMWSVTLVGAALAQNAADGVVSAMRDQVHLERGGRSVPVVHGMAVQVHDRFSTGAGGLVTITLSDKTQIELGGNSEFIVVQNEVEHGSRKMTRMALLQGLLHSLVRFAPGNAPNYEVQTPNAIAAARGTDYDTRYTHDEKRKRKKDCREYTDVKVYDGIVEVTNRNNPAAGSIKVKKGHKATVACAYLPDPPSTAAVLSGGALALMGAGGGVVTGIGLGGGLREPMTSSH